MGGPLSSFVFGGRGEGLEIRRDKTLVFWVPWGKKDDNFYRSSS